MQDLRVGFESMFSNFLMLPFKVRSPYLRLLAYGRFRGQKNFFSLKNDDGISLADALNLLSPQKESLATEYLPSLLDSWRHGLANEKFSKKAAIQEEFKMPSSDTKRHLDHLLAGLNVFSNHTMSNYELLTSPPHIIRKYIKSLETEDEIIEVAKLFFYQDKLTFLVLFELVLSKNLTNIKRLPVEINNLSPEVLPYWHEESFVRWNVVMLKKYYDQKKPLQIVKNLKENFELVYLPSIQEGKLPPFYERIVWKFHHEYFKQSSKHEPTDLRSKILLWEATSDSDALATALLKNKQLDTLQRILFEISSNEALRVSMSSRDYAHFMGRLKRLSMRNKLHALHLSEGFSHRERELIVQLTCLSIEKLLQDSLGNEELLARVRNLREGTISEDLWQLAPV